MQAEVLKLMAQEKHVEKNKKNKKTTTTTKKKH